MLQRQKIFSEASFERIVVQISAACNVGLEFTTCSLMLVPLKPKYPSNDNFIFAGEWGGGGGRAGAVGVNALRRSGVGTGRYVASGVLGDTCASESRRSSELAFHHHHHLLLLILHSSPLFLALSLPPSLAPSPGRCEAVRPCTLLAVRPVMGKCAVRACAS